VFFGNLKVGKCFGLNTGGGEFCFPTSTHTLTTDNVITVQNLNKPKTTTTEMLVLQQDW